MKNIATVPLEAFRWNSYFGLRTWNGQMCSWMVEEAPLIFRMVFVLVWAWWNSGNHGISVWKQGRERWQYLIWNIMQCGKLALFHNYSCLQVFLSMSCPFCGCGCFVCRGGESLFGFGVVFRWLVKWFPCVFPVQHLYFNNDNIFFKAFFSCLWLNKARKNLGYEEVKLQPPYLEPQQLLWLNSMLL